MISDDGDDGDIDEEDDNDMIILKDNIKVWMNGGKWEESWKWWEESRIRKKTFLKSRHEWNNAKVNEIVILKLSDGCLQMKTDLFRSEWQYE